MALGPRNAGWLSSLFVAAVFSFWLAISAPIAFDFLAEDGRVLRVVGIEQLSWFSGSFDVVGVVFSGVAIVLLYMTYQTQKLELVQIQSHLASEQRRQRAAYLIDRLERKLQEVTAGNLRGPTLIRWMHSEMDLRFAIDVAAGDGRPTSAWESVLDHHGFPDASPLAQLVYSTLGLARVVDEAVTEEEKEDLAELARSVFFEESIVPLLYASAMTLRGRQKQLVLMARFFKKLQIRPVIVEAFDLGAVPGGVPATIDDALRAR